MPVPPFWIRTCAEPPTILVGTQSSVVLTTATAAPHTHHAKSTRWFVQHTRLPPGYYTYTGFCLVRCLPLYVPLPPQVNVGLYMTKVLLPLQHLVCAAVAATAFTPERFAFNAATFGALV